MQKWAPLIKHIRIRSPENIVVSKENETSGKQAIINKEP